MTGRFRLYPDLWWPRLGYMLADAALLFWIAAWIAIGNAVYNAIMTLSIIADSVIATGRELNNAVFAVQDAVNNLPLIGGSLHDALRPLHVLPVDLMMQGQSELVAIHSLAVKAWIVVAAIPIVIYLLRYLPWRARKSRGFRYLDALLRRPGARAVTTTMHVLAGRALYTMPYDTLLQYSADPLLEWREGRYYNLARATLASEGLDVRRYLRRVEGLEPQPLPPQIPTIGDE